MLRRKLLTFGFVVTLVGAFMVPAIAFADEAQLQVNISGVTKPVVGQQPSFAATVTPEGIEVSTDSNWTRFDGNSFVATYEDDSKVSSVAFLKGHKYQLLLLLKLPAGTNTSSLSVSYEGVTLEKCESSDPLRSGYEVLNEGGDTDHPVIVAALYFGEAESSDVDPGAGEGGGEPGDPDEVNGATGEGEPGSVDGDGSVEEGSESVPAAKPVLAQSGDEMPVAGLIAAMCLACIGTYVAKRKLA